MNKLRTLALLLTFLSGVVSAHTALSESTPADGVVLEKAPESLMLSFTESVRLLRAELVMLREGEAETVGTEFKATSSSTKQHSVPLPALPDGQYRVKWAVLGADGHPVEGILSFSVGMEAEHSGHDEASGHHDQASGSAGHGHGAE